MHVDNETLLEDENYALKLENQRLKAENEDLRRQIDILATELRSLKVVNELPKEILWLIFQRAIPPTGLLDSSLSAGPDSPWTRTLEVKKTLTLVCRGWHEVGTCFLFEDVTIRRLPQLVSLLRTLEESSGQDLGKLIKSLELSCYIPGGSIAEDFGLCLQTLFSLCPLLKRFSYSSQCRLPPAVLRHDEPLSASITELSLDKTVDSATVHRILAHTQNNLRYLRMGTPIADWPSPYERDQPSSAFPFLHTLWLEICGDRQGPEMNAMATWALPSLNRLIVTHVWKRDDSYAVGEGSSRTKTVNDATASFLTRCGGTIKELCLHECLCDGAFLQQLLDCCPLLEHLTTEVVHMSEEIATFRLGPHSSLRCVDFLSTLTRMEDIARVQVKVDDIPSFLGYRKFFGLPSFAYRWLHELSCATEADIHDSFEVNIFHHQLVKFDKRIDWNVVWNTPRPQDIEDETCCSEASSDEVIYDVFESASSDDLSDKAPEDWKDVLVSGGSETDLLDDDVVSGELDAECDIFETLLVKDTVGLLTA